MPAWRRAALSRVKPTPEEEEAVQQDARALLERVQAALDDHDWAGEPRIEGSLAKGTYLHGEADVDIFIRFPTDVSREAMTQRVHVLKELLDDPVVAYAEHPYAQGAWRGHDAELVPCYALDDPADLRSAVDRTPFHTEHVEQQLTDELRDEVRLLKAFLSAAGCYGAEEAVRGVSGYLAELMVLHAGSFDEVLSWAVEGFEHPVVLEDQSRERFEDPLVVVDPVDPTRNAAAAVSRSVLGRFREAAAAFRMEPDAGFFVARPPPEMGPQRALEVCRARASRVLALAVPIEGAELEDPLWAQLRRALSLATAQLEREQVPVRGACVHLALDDGGDGTGWALVETDAGALERPYLHSGPPADVDEHAESFRERWAEDPAAAGSVFEEDGRLFVRVERSEQTLAAIVAPHLRDANAGKVVDAALADGSARWLEGDPAIAELPPTARARLLDRRRPWQRPAVALDPPT